MSNEELMQKRVKVINDYPESIFQIGEILVCVVDEEEGTQYVFGNNQYADNLCPELYPAIFKKLEWWEDRKPEDMPEYLKCDRPYMVIKFSEMTKTSHPFDESELQYQFGSYHICNFIPSTETETEYNEYRLLNP